MNPGYAGRAELPDNLKALFRTVAMMVPDYALIARISLFSFGFEQGEALSYKITTTYTLCSEQLSTQKHYDYGMRAVKSVITAAGNLKRAYPDQDEQELVLRAINDVNLAKFLSFDLPLYTNITKDLFPGIVLPEPDYDDLLGAIRNQAQKPEFNMQCTDYVMVKIIQLFEMVQVRHGLMVVGLPFSGKSTAIKLLAAGMAELAERQVPGWFKTIMCTVNPKSVTLAQLYGTFDEISGDWTDGILPIGFRRLATMDPKDRQWLIFDGPVDAIWIESMNTVLDDNKKLCLTNGEIIQMGTNMTMMFEPMDLLVASPATVSRCGMVYMQPQELGWEPLYESWKNTLPKHFQVDGNEKFAVQIDELVDVLIQPCLDFIRDGQVSELTPTVDQNLLNGLLRNLSVGLRVFDDAEFTKVTDKKTQSSIIDSIFIYSIIWSVCISIDTFSRKKFDIHVKKICDGQYEGFKKFSRRVLPGVMDRGMIYDYVYFPAENKWTPWNDLVELSTRDKFPAGTLVQDIVVTTVDSIRYQYIMESNIRNQIPTLFCGPTGTGKSAYIKNVILNRLEKDKFLPIEVGFSAQSKAQMVQGIVDLKLDSKRGSGRKGPKLGIKAVVFVDDLNMPKQEESLAMPPVEILRQLLDQGGWYDLKDPKHPFVKLVDTTVVAAMGPPGGGKSIITPRFQRWFNTVIFALVDEQTMKNIFQSILSYNFRENKFSNEIVACNEKLVSATLIVYKRIQEDLKPTPAKSHYTFNLRDVSKVICGICLMEKTSLTQTDTAVRLWAHETSRVFGDRLINESDRKWILEAIQDCVRAPFGSDFNTLFRHLDTNQDGKVDTIDEFRGLLFGDIYTPFGMTEREYCELLDKDKLKLQAVNALEQYNGIVDTPMDLVLFNFAIEHLLRITRIIRQPNGHALLVGVGGSGRQSLTRLASKIPDYDIYQIEIKKVYRMVEFREDVKNLMRGVGGKGQQTTFIFNDNSIKEDAFLEDINNILNTGEVPNIFSAEERVECCDLVRQAAKEEQRCLGGSPQEFFTYFIERCKKNLHIVLAFSPIGEALRKRILSFPSLVNCTTIDWFSEWPADALQSVADQFLQDVTMDDDVRSSCTEMVQLFHTSTFSMSQRFLTELKRNYYVTPTSFLELIQTFKQLLGEKRKEVSTNRDRYANGYKTLIETEKKVNEMSEYLEQLKPKLVIKAEEVGKQTVVVEKEASEAEVIADSVSADAAVAKKAADASDAIAQDCKNALAEAMPALLAAEKALEAITNKDITMIKSVLSPTTDTLMVLTTVAILLKVNPIGVMNPETNKKEWQYWKPIQTMMNKPGFRQSLMEYPKEEITEEMIKKIKPHLDHQNFNNDKLKTVSTTIAAFGDWVMAMNKFYFVNLIVIPKKAALAKAQSEYEVVAAELRIKQAALDEIMGKVNKLKQDLQDTKDELADLEAQLEDCKARLIKAESLIGSLSKEKHRWNELAQTLAIDLVNITGDVLIASGMIAYLGAFNSSYRSELTNMWVKESSKRDIPNSGEFSLRQVLGNPVEIRQWNLQQLPSDDFSTENAIITKTARRWPLFIDPQGQANKWIRNLGKDKKIKVLKFTDNNYLKYLEACIRQGIPVLIENVGTDLDPAIEPLLQKQIVKRGASYNIKIGDATIEYDMRFRFYLTTKLRNPHYLPEVSTKVTLLNFMITFEGLSDQLLGIVVEKENPELQMKKENLVVESANNKKKLAEIEEQILKTLQESEDILGDEAGINVLTNASVVSVQINQQQEIAAKVEIEIDEARSGYYPLAKTTSGLFFCIQELAFINTMYQYSLPFFVHLFTMAIDEAEASEELEERLQNLSSEFLSSLYRNICRSLFEQDKPIFSMMLTFKLLDMRKELNETDLRFLLTGGVSLGEKVPDCPAHWMSKQAWGEMVRACNLKTFKGFMQHFIEAANTDYLDLYEMPDPNEFKWPEAAEKILSDFTKLIVIRIIKPDKLVPALVSYVVKNIGEEFVQPPPFDLAAIYKDSTNITPLIFVLSPGSDPMKALETIATAKKRVLKAVSLGKGQGVKAEKYIEEAMKTGEWVVLQNCHLAAGWLKNLEKICEDLRETGSDPSICKREFRLWLTSYPADDFPVSILQNGVKMTNEPPKGLRANILNSFNVTPINELTFFNGNSQPEVFKKLLFGLLCFHAVIQERRLYGPLGWIRKYEFNEPDLRISVRQLDIFLETYAGEKVPFDALHYCIGHCNYGGRVTDAKDRITLNCLLLTFFCQESLEEGYKYSPSGTYFCPMANGAPEDYHNYVKSLPQFPKPEIFGMHENAAITKEVNETKETLFQILNTKQQAGSGSSDQDKIATDLANDILSKVPDPFDVKKAERIYPISYTESMNTVLTQELARYNGLINCIKQSLKDLKRAILGEILMAEEIEDAMIAMCDGLIPAMWIKAGFNSLKPLASYIKDLQIRLEFFQVWVENGIPEVFWINKFFFTHGFLTGALQNYARKYKIAIDTLAFDQYVVHDAPADGVGVKKPEDGLYCIGMIIEGAKWCPERRYLDESDPKILYTACPMIHFMPKKKDEVQEEDVFACPLFKTADRLGVLMTTGHSTNYVCDVRLPIDVPSKHWIMRGTAMLLSLSE